MANFVRVCIDCDWVLYNTEVEDCPLCHKKLIMKSEQDFKSSQSSE